MLDTLPLKNSEIKVTKKDAEASDGASWIWTSSLIRVTMPFKLKGGISWEEKTMSKSALKISQYPYSSIVMGLHWMSKELTQIGDCKAYDRPCISEVQKLPYKPSISFNISKGLPIILDQLNCVVHWRRSRLASQKTSWFKEL